MLWPDRTKNKFRKTIDIPIIPPIGREAACPSARQMARDEARHGKALEGMLKRYFNK